MRRAMMAGLIGPLAMSMSLNVSMMRNSEAAPRGGGAAGYVSSMRSIRLTVGGRQVTAQGSLTITSARDDDTLRGVLVLRLPAEAAGKQSAGESAVTVPEVAGRFVHGTSCPLIRVEVAPVRTENVETGRMVFEFRETRDEMAQLFCVWTRQINARRSRKGVIAAVNRLLSGDQ